MSLDPKDPVALTQALIQCPSVTPEEGGALRLLDSVLKERGFESHLVRFSEENTPDIDNLYARIGTEGPCLVFAGHTDVVPTGDETRWTQAPFSGAIVDGILYGRGAADMKGGVAASVSATLNFIEEQGASFKGSIAFLITGDEEGPAVNGTVKLLEWAKARGEKFDHCILGEPTNPNRLGDMIKIGRRGSLSGHLVVEGKQGHIAYPHLAENPIRGIVKLIAGLNEEPLDHGTDHFPPSNLEFSTVDVGNKASNVIPQSARASFNIRFNDKWTQDSLKAEIENRLRLIAGNTVRYTVTFEPSNADSFVTAPGPFVDMAIQSIEQSTGIRPELSTSGGTSDARFIKNYCPVIEFGLVGQTMHQIDERVPVADIVKLETIYRGFLARYFS
ncbi:MAG: succinyl-diaminopimelate desuccinylase [Hyphomicrobiales bacterium]|nr:succinyl-diaminopimelate desuccinylase [Hyphomicrobiales bacterium]